jgi:hypothetical protein
MPRLESPVAPGRLRPPGGCLWGCLTRVLAALVLGSAILVALTALFVPWGFFLGGRFHFIPYWQGWGRLHTRESGDYVLFMRLEPRPPTRLGSATVSGLAYLCTPRGERIRLALGGLMGRHLGLSTDGEAISFHLYNRPVFYLTPQRRPRIDLKGQWRNPNLVLEDEGSLSISFLKDGRVNDGALPAAGEKVSVTVVPGRWADFEAACASVQRAAR